VASTISDDLRASALSYHHAPRPGKLEIQPTKPLGNQRDLALAYTPGLAAACEAIAADAGTAADLTARANLVAVVSNGSAVLGLGNIGPLAAKPVMEGKAVLFKKFAGLMRQPMLACWIARARQLSRQTKRRRTALNRMSEPEFPA
jgi:malate dehydrogenase (oxaloacetate-decarboxylating)(NADP+)